MIRPALKISLWYYLFRHAREAKWHAGSRMAALVRKCRLRVLYFCFLIIRVLCCHQNSEKQDGQRGVKRREAI